MMFFTSADEGLNQLIEVYFTSEETAQQIIDRVEFDRDIPEHVKAKACKMFKQWSCDQNIVEEDDLFSSNYEGDLNDSSLFY
jgi:hypothetical protein